MTKTIKLPTELELNIYSRLYHHGWNKKSENKVDHMDVIMNNGALEEFWKKLASFSQPKLLAPEKNIRVKREKKRNLSEKKENPLEIIERTKNPTEEMTNLNLVQSLRNWQK